MDVWQAEGYRLHVSGHSLGGTLAVLAALALPQIAGGHIFNPGAGVPDADLVPGGSLVMRQVDMTDNAKRVQCVAVHHMFGDLISCNFLYGRWITYRGGQSPDVHGINNFV